MRGLLAWPGTCFLRGTGRESTDERAIGLVMPATALSSFNRSDSLGCTRSTRMPFTHTTCCQFVLIADSPSLCVCFCITRLAGTSGFGRGERASGAHGLGLRTRRCPARGESAHHSGAKPGSGRRRPLVSRRSSRFRAASSCSGCRPNALWSLLLWWWAARRFGVLRGCRAGATSRGWGG